MHCRSHAKHQSKPTARSTGEVLKLSIFATSKQHPDRNPVLRPMPPEPPAAAAAPLPPPAAVAAARKRVHWSEPLWSSDGREGELPPPLPQCPQHETPMIERRFVPDIDTPNLECELCGSKINKDDMHFSCAPCDYDLCQECSFAPPPLSRPASPSPPRSKRMCG